MFGTHFYNEGLRKLTIAFGQLFNNVVIQNTSSTGAVTKRIRVPLAYAPKEKFLVRLEQQANLQEDRAVAVTLPRLGFEITGLAYDSSRKINKMQKMRRVKTNEEGNEVYAQRLLSNPLVMTNGSTVLKVRHRDHGMYSTSNNVVITGASSLISTTLSGALTTSSTSLTLASSTNFPSSGTVHLKINNEIISGTISGTAVSSLTRGIGDSDAAAHSDGATVELYMLHKVPFTEINKTHTAIANIGTDYYTVALSTTPVVASSGDSEFGGKSVVATENAVYDSSSTIIGSIIPSETDIIAKVRHTTSTSPSGSQTSFVQTSLNNAETVPLNDTYSYDTCYMIASSINETNELSGGKSLIMPLTLSSTNKNVSPVIDLKRLTFLAVANRINSIDSSADVYPTTIYDPPTDPEGDDHDAIYITKKVALENPATSLKVLFDANREDTADIKVLHRTLRVDDATGFDDLDFKFFNDDGTVADSGGPDVSVAASLGLAQYNEYEFTAGVTDDGIGTPLDEFIAFQIKIVMRATNSARPPRIKDLRVLALAT